jgi:hypothetical protein
MPNPAFSRPPRSHHGRGRTFLPGTSGGLFVPIHDMRHAHDRSPMPYQPPWTGNLMGDNGHLQNPWSPSGELYEFDNYLLRMDGDGLDDPEPTFHDDHRGARGLALSIDNFDLPFPDLSAQLVPHSPRKTQDQRVHDEYQDDSRVQCTTQGSNFVGHRHGLSQFDRHVLEPAVEARAGFSRRLFCTDRRCRLRRLRGGDKEPDARKETKEPRELDATLAYIR